MWLIPLLVIAIVVASSRERGSTPVCVANPRAMYVGQTILELAPPVSLRGEVAPSPILVLGELALGGHPIPPTVILCAIAEAETMGRPDIASEIVRLFVAPVVYRHQQARMIAPPPAMPTMPVQREPERERGRGERPPSCSPREVEMRAEMRAALEPVIDDRELVSLARPSRPQPVMIASPIVGVDPSSWGSLRDRFAREAPTFESSRHVGQYRQRRERLAELGIDPSTVVGDAEAQRDALDADLADAHARLAETGDLHALVGRSVNLPGEDEPHQVTLSGVLGVVQAAGLENAIMWFASSHDRKRYPHTTRAFQRTNGVF